MSGNQIKAGAGKAAVQIPEAFFPMEKFVGIHDGQHVRTVILEQEEKIAIVSVEITSIMADVIEDMKNIITEKTGIAGKNIWIGATHTFAAPHPLGGPMLKNAGPKELEKGALYKKALYGAVEESVQTALEAMGPAQLFYGRGECDVNVNRDIPSEEGWWIGLNPEGPSDKQVRVIGIKDGEGKVLAVLYHYGVQSSILDNVFDENGGRLITTDLVGEASNQVEKNLEDGAVALCLLGPCGDQVPKQRAKYSFTDEENHLQEIDLGQEKGFEMISCLGGQLGQVILQILKYGLTEIEEPDLSMEEITVSCPRQKKLFEGFPVPSKTFESIPDGEMETAVTFLKLTEQTMLVGVKPELNYVTAQEIQKQSPFAETLVVQMVNGAQKYMADRQSYERRTYEAMNAFFGVGAAEKLSEEIEKYMNGTKEHRKEQ